jgi:PAS domain S-box-containing protein
MKIVEANTPDKVIPHLLETVYPNSEAMKNLSKELHNNLYDALVRTIQDGLILIKDGKIYYANKTIADMLGYSLEEMVGEEILKCVAEYHKDLVYERYKKRIQGKFVPAHYEIDLLHKDGNKVIPVSLNVSLVNSETETLKFVLIKDRSEINKTTEKLKKRENEFETAFNHTGVAIAILDFEGNLKRINEKWKDLFGSLGEDNSAKNIREVLPQNDIEEVNANLTEIVRDKNKVYRSLRSFRKKNNEIFWGDQSITAVRNDQDEIQYLISSIIDVTVRKKIELQYEHERKLLQYFMDSVPDSIYFKDTKSRFIKANKATLNKMGLNSFDELIGKTDHDLFAKEHADKAKADEVVIIQNGLSILDKIEKEVWPDGKVNWVSTTKIPLKDESDNIIGTFGITKDISSLKKSEDVRDALYKISNAISTINKITELYAFIHRAITDLMKADNFYIALYHENKETVSFPYFVDQFDPVPEERKTGRGLTEYILRHGDAKLIDAELDLKLREEGETSLLGEPTQIWLGVPLKVKGKTIGAIVVQDYDDASTYGEDEKEILTYVSEQIALAIDKKQSEEKIIQYSEELKELNASKDKFFSVVAHDLKSPFHGLLGLTQMMVEEYETMNDDEVRSSLTLLKESTESTYKLIENLLNWSRLQTGRMKYEPANQNMFLIVEETRLLLNQNARMKNVSIRNKLGPQSIIWGDCNMLQSLLQNLVSNAIKFTNPEGYVEITEKDLGNKIQYSVADTGIGILPENVSKLFRIDVNFTTRGTLQEKGTGLGLVLCKEIVNIHGGEINVDSKIDVGTKITFTVNKSKHN